MAQGVGSIRNNIITGMTHGMGLHLVFSIDGNLYYNIALSLDGIPLFINMGAQWHMQC